MTNLGVVDTKMIKLLPVSFPQSWLEAYIKDLLGVMRIEIRGGGTYVRTEVKRSFPGKVTFELSFKE